MGKMKELARNRAEWLKREALALGFSAVGIARADFLAEEATHLETWLKRGFAGEMAYLERNADKRLDPRVLYPGTRSVVSLVFNYHNPERPQGDDAPRVAQYAFGEDYHFVLKWKLKELLKKARVEWGDFQGRAFVDSAPVHERAWARRAGLGWVGKNSLLLNKGMGSYFFLAELLVDLDLQPDRPNPVDHCGTCTRCIDACPTGAIIQPQVVDGSRCISYFTIELRGEIPEPYARQLGDWAFGCDVCQEVCPWNRHATPHSEPRLAPREGMMELSREDWLDLTEETFRAIFKETPLKRTGLDKIRRTITGGELRSQDWDRDSLRS